MQLTTDIRWQEPIRMPQLMQKSTLHTRPFLWNNFCCFVFFLLVHLMLTSTCAHEQNENKKNERKKLKQNDQTETEDDREKMSDRNKREKKVANENGLAIAHATANNQTNREWRVIACAARAFVCLCVCRHRRRRCVCPIAFMPKSMPKPMRAGADPIRLCTYSRFNCNSRYNCATNCNSIDQLLLFCLFFFHAQNENDFGNVSPFCFRRWRQRRNRN